MAQETLEIEKWLYETLSGDAMITAQVSTRIYSYQAPAGAAMPFILYSFQGGSDLNSLGSVRSLSGPLYQVKVVGLGSSMAALKTVADRIDALLQGATKLSAQIVLRCLREQSISYPETDGDARFNHLGGLYRVIVQGTT